MRRYDRVCAAAGREQWTVRLWWAGMALVTAVVLAWLLHRQGIRTEWIAAGLLLWAVAWVAPWTAMLSLHRRAKIVSPLPGSGSPADWRRHAAALGDYVEWGLRVVSDRETRIRLSQARAALRKVLKAKPSRQRLEAVCAETQDFAILPLKKALWRQLMPDIMPMVEEAREKMAVASSEEAFLTIQYNMMLDTAATTACALYPHLLMGELLAGIRQCAAVAAAYAHPDDALLPIAATLVIEWGDPTRPWLPCRVRQAAARLIDPALRDWTKACIGENVPGEDAAQDAEPAAEPATATGEAPAPAPSDAPAEDANDEPMPPHCHHHRSESPDGGQAQRHGRAHAHRRHHRHHHHHHHSRLAQLLSPSHDLSRIVKSFFQRLYYLVHGWWIYH